MTMTIEQLQGRLREIHARIGFEGRFSFTINQDGPEPKCYVTHWFRSSDYAFEDCKAVGLGSLEECLAALERYADAYRRRPTREGGRPDPGRDPRAGVRLLRAGGRVGSPREGA